MQKGDSVGEWARETQQMQLIKRLVKLFLLHPRRICHVKIHIHFERGAQLKVELVRPANGHEVKWKKKNKDHFSLRMRFQLLIAQLFYRCVLNLGISPKIALTLTRTCFIYLPLAFPPSLASILSDCLCRSLFHFPYVWRDSCSFVLSLHSFVNKLLAICNSYFMWFIAILCNTAIYSTEIGFYNLKLHFRAAYLFLFPTPLNSARW